MTSGPFDEERFCPVKDPYAKGPAVNSDAKPYRSPLQDRAERRDHELGQPTERDPSLDLKDATLLILKLVRGRDDAAARNARAWLLRRGLMPNPLRASDEDPEVPV